MTSANGHIPHDSAELPPTVERIADRFESAWEQGPCLDDFLPAGGPERLAALLTLVHIDLERRLKAGEAIRVETYLRRYPELESAPEAVPDLAVAEYRLRRRREPELTPADYLARFPRYAALLQARFDALGGPEAARPPTCPQAKPETQPTPATAGGTATGTWPEVPGYELLAELGRGAFGVVYQARQRRLGRVVALKVLRDGALADAEQRARFQAEAEVVARLHHPNVVQIYEVGESEGRPFFAMEWVDGGSLAERLGGKPQPARAAAQLVETLARAVHAAHQRNVVHRDLKPGNVLLTQDGTPKVTDFGLAKRMDAAAGLTKSNAIMGTPPYMAPEQAQARTRDIGPVTDVYALGAILYELLTGRPPFRAETDYDTLLLVVNEDPVPPRRLQPKVPRDLETICLKCLAKAAKKRYASALDLAKDLRRFQAGEPIAARPVGRGERLWSLCRRQPLAPNLFSV
jgi:serine/threonine-protein kinase